MNGSGQTHWSSNESRRRGESNAAEEQKSVAARVNGSSFAEKRRIAVISVRYTMSCVRLRAGSDGFSGERGAAWHRVWSQDRTRPTTFRLSSLDPLTAICEAQAPGRLPFAPTRPNLSSIAWTKRDTGAERSRLSRVGGGVLAGSTPASQALADRLVAAGYAGMRVQSFAPMGAARHRPVGEGVLTSAPHASPHVG